MKIRKSYLVKHLRPKHESNKLLAHCLRSIDFDDDVRITNLFGVGENQWLMLSRNRVSTASMPSAWRFARRIVSMKAVG